MTLTLFDVALLVLIVLVVIKVTITGFITEFFSKAAVIIGTMGAILFYLKLAPYIVKIIGPDVFPEIIAFLIIFLSLYLMVKLIQQLVGSAFQGETMTNLDRALGFFLGIAEGFLVVIVVLILIQKQPWFDLSSLTKNSLFTSILEPFLSEGQGFITGFIPVI